MPRGDYFMPRFIRRIWNILRGKSDVLLRSMEKPEEQLSVFVSELNGQIQDLQRSVANAIADEKRLQKQIEALGSKSTEWELRAIAALEEAGDEELAKAALLKQEECDDEASALREGWESQKQATATLKVSLRGAKTRMEEARRKYNLLLAQYKSVQTKQKIQASLSASTMESPMHMMEALEEKIRQMEAETEAQLELEPGSSTPDIEAQFVRLDQKRKGDEALAQLRAKVEERKRIPATSAPEGDRAAELKKTLTRD
jgi:phage shock protein A